MHVQANANTNFLYLEYKKKCMTDYQKKEDALQVLTRNNYLVSDQKVTSETAGSSNSNRQNKNKPATDISQRINLLNTIDKMMIDKTAIQKQPVYNPNSFYNPSQPRTPFKQTEQTLQQIQSMIN
jgi:hypothetical protein